VRLFLQHIWSSGTARAKAAEKGVERGSGTPVATLSDNHHVRRMERRGESGNGDDTVAVYLANGRERQVRRFSYEGRRCLSRSDDAETPHFGHLSNTRFALERPSDDDRSLVHARMELPDDFTPSRPMRWGPGFVGRGNELRRIIGAIEDELSHLAIYGEHGQGKTSLAHALSDLAAVAGYQVAYFGCSPELDFEQIFRRVFRNLPERRSYASSAGSANDNGQGGIEDWLPSGPLGPVDVATVVARFRSAQVIVVLDDFEQASAATRHDVNELMKRISDLSGRMTIVVIGCGRRIEHLLETEASVRTAVVLELPRMTDEEIAAVIERGAARMGVVWSPGVVAAITDHSRGSPYVAHLLALYATRRALEHSRLVVDEIDLRAAVSTIHKEMPRALPVAVDGSDRDFDEASTNASPSLTAGPEVGGGGAQHL
jgi:hypothetical protein